MADDSVSSGTDVAGAGESDIQRQARLRREKRAAKMATQGDERLARIKALNGGVAPPEEVLGGPTVKPTSNSAAQSASVADDPEEVDISQSNSGFGTPRSGRKSQPGGAGSDPLTQAMMQMQMQQQEQARNSGGDGGQGEDPMVKMMQQMMGMMGGNPDDPNSAANELPAALKAMMSGQGQPQQPPSPPSSSLYVWRIVHAVFALSLATFIALTSTFNGSKLARSQSVYSDETGYGIGPRLFVLFCTAELILQSTRYFVEKGQLQGPGILAKIANSGFVPEPYASYVRQVGRYITIAQTIFQDALLVIFCFGAIAWWKGMAASNVA